MSYATILAVLSGLADDEITLRAAVDLVAKTGGQVRALLALPSSDGEYMMRTEGIYMTAAMVEALTHDEADAKRRTEALIKGLSIKAGPSIHPLPNQSAINLQLDGETALCDLVVVGQATITDQGPWAGVVSAGLMRGLAPCLIIRRPFGAAPAAAAIAWDGSPAAGRAVRAALPLLSAASRVVLLQDPDAIARSNTGAAPLDRLRTYLQGHGVNEIEIVLEPGCHSASGLANLAEARGVGLLVAGAFSHSRLFEQLIGGVTNDLMKANSAFNLLLSH